MSTTTGFQPFPMENLPVILEDFPTLYGELVPIAEAFTNGWRRASFLVTEWVPKADEYYLAFRMAINLDDINDWALRLVEGTPCDTTHEIVDTDGFLDIKRDMDSIRLCVEHVLRDAAAVPLWNRGLKVEDNPIYSWYEDEDLL